MIADRKTIKTWYNYTSEKITVILSSPDCSKGTTESAHVFHSILKDIIDQPALLECGNAKMFDSASILHDGTKWIFKLEAIVVKQIE